MVPPGGGHHGDEGGGLNVTAALNATVFHSVAEWCNKNITGDLYHRYCQEVNGTMSCDSFFTSNEPTIIPGIPGMASGVIHSKHSSRSQGQ